MAELSERNAGKILDILEDVMIDGVASISTLKLLNIYSKDRVTKSIWRDIYDRWTKLSELEGYDIAPQLLVAYETGFHKICFAFGKTVDSKTKTETDFLVPVDKFLVTNNT